MRKYWSYSFLSILALASCGGDTQDRSADAGETDSDASSNSETDGRAGLPNTCTGDCAVTTLVANFGATTRSFDRAFFGLTSPQKSDSGDWEIYIENGAGDDDQCPNMNSPTPDYLLILAGLPLATENPGPVTATANLVDFEGALVPGAPVEEATTNTVTWSAYDPCIACAEGSEEDRASRMLAVDIEATFPGGTISGHSYATHCDSLDEL